MSNDLRGKVALITGGTTGIGAATAKLFLSEGATVIVTGSRPESVAKVQAENSGVEALVSDQGDPIASKALVEQIKVKHGCIDFLFVNAGIGYPTYLEQVSEGDFDELFRVNVKGAFFTVKHAQSIMPAGGAIILTASNAAAAGLSGMSAYSATKAALRSFGRTLAAELAPRGIRVNVVSPGPIATPIFEKTGLPSERIAELLEQLLGRMPLGRVGSVDEIAKAVRYLAVDATFTTAGELMADGGMIDT